jgi:hypothetical protein
MSILLMDQLLFRLGPVPAVPARPTVLTRQILLGDCLGVALLPNYLDPKCINVMFDSHGTCHQCSPVQERLC